MTSSEAVALRIKELLAKYKLSQYKLERNSVLSHYTLRAILKGKTKDIKLSTIVNLCYGFKISLSEFFDSDLFDYNNTDFFK